MTTPEEIARTIIDKLLHGTYGENPRFDFDERQLLSDELVQRIRAYGDECAVAEREQDRCFVTLCDRLTEDRLWSHIETGLGYECRARAATIRD